ncbi:glycosyltransferase family 2 protein [Haloferax sp. YSMS24]|uniref:glycosyltransferase family 2 protein n=1 Tax=Haloferax sp. YSMS24 TaxID=3388425 RepID=UPI00398C9170
MATETRQILAIILNWNDYENTKRCIQSVHNIDSVDTLLVDNNSTNSSSQRIEREFPDISAIHREENGGFAKGMNTGIRYAKKENYEYVWLLNNDVVVTDCNPQQIVEKMRENGAGAASPVVTTPNGSGWFVKGVIDKKRARAIDVVDEVDTNSVVENDYVPFAAALIDVEVFNQVGLLPEKYFLYYEDVEFCSEMTESGFTIITVPRQTVQHVGGQTTNGPILTYYLARNRLLFARDYLGVTGAVMYIDYLNWFFRVFTSAVFSRSPSRVNALIRGTVDGMNKKHNKGPYPDET